MPEISFNSKTPFTLRQKEIFEACKIGSPYKEIFVCTGRQVGKTFTLIRAALMYLVQNKSFRIGFFMPSWSQCKGVFEKIFNGFEGQKMIKRLFKFNKSTLTIDFLPKNSTIQFYTADNDNCRGNTFNALIVDEACFVKDEIWQAAILPTIMVSLSQRNDAKVLCFSTPKKKNWFYNSIKTPKEGRIVFEFTSIEGGLISQMELDEQRKNLPPHVFANEFEGKFFEAGMGILKYQGCLIEHPKDFEKDYIAAALDWGVDNDSTVLTIGTNKGQILFARQIKHKDVSKQIDEIAKHLLRYKPKIIYSEKNGIGVVPTQQLQTACSKFNNYRPAVEAWITSASSKTDIVNQLIVDFQKNILKIPTDWLDVDWAVMQTQLDQFAMKYNTESKKITFGGENGFHDDFVMSLAILNYKMSKKRGNTQIKFA